MFEGYYGKEPFDLRLTVLRLMANWNRILLITLAGTLLFGGGYYVKNVLLHTQREYTATATYMLEYVNPPQQAGDYYINHATWNTLVQSEEFLTAVEGYLEMFDSSWQELAAAASQDAEGGEVNLVSMVSATLPSDWNVPTTTVLTGDAEFTALLTAAVEAAMESDLAGMTEAVGAVHVIDPGVSKEVVPDVRPTRALVLSALLSFFFAVVFCLLKEIGDDSVWLPGSLRVRYGLKVLGTVNSPEYKENFDYLFAHKTKIAVCPLDERIDSTEAVKTLQSTLGEREWIAQPAPLLCPEGAEKLREAEAILLLVPAGARVGKKLEYVLEYLKQQDCDVTGAVLWDADERLLKVYYCLGE